MEVEYIAKILIAVFLLVVLVFAADFLIGEKGSAILGALKNILRFGG